MHSKLQLNVTTRAPSPSDRNPTWPAQRRAGKATFGHDVCWGKANKARVESNARKEQRQQETPRVLS